jgi:hypothetical protein
LILVQVALLSFALFAVASIAVDLGYARLTQAQMQNAADSAAIEASRSGSRDEAVEMVDLFFDDNLDPATDEPDRPPAGAGPYIELSGGVTDLQALQSIGAVGVYNRRRQSGVSWIDRNEANRIDGDIDQGEFTGCPPAAPTCTEQPDYSRPDFNRASPAPDSYLVRMRRSNEAGANGPSIPFLFGRGTLIHPEPDGYSARRDGITVRATAIASARPARSVGISAGPGLPGVTAFALQRSFWESGSDAVVVDAVSGAIRDTGNSVVVGQFFQPGGGTGVGDPILPAPPSTALDGYIPIYELISGEERVIGYVWGSISTTSGPAVLTRRIPRVAPSNASVHNLRPRPGLTPQDWALIYAANRALVDALLAPVLVR